MKSWKKVLRLSSCWTVDSVVASEVYEHLEHREDFLEEVRRILKPGDPLAVIAEPDEPRDAAAIDRALVELSG